MTQMTSKDGGMLGVMESYALVRIEDQTVQVAGKEIVLAAGMPGKQATPQQAQLQQQQTKLVTVVDPGVGWRNAEGELEPSPLKRGDRPVLGPGKAVATPKIVGWPSSIGIIAYADVIAVIRDKPALKKV